MSAQTRLDESNLLEYLRNSSLLEPAQQARIESVGDGNINWVRRVRTADASWVVKQARAALERFPEYEASTERLLHEARFYAQVAPFDGEGVCPRVLHLDEAQRVLVLEDLGDCERLDHALARGADVADAAARLAGFLGRVHVGTRDPALAKQFSNGEMRELHGEHIFSLPYQENDFPLSPAVAVEARSVRDDDALMARIAEARERYYGAGRCLVHGDVQPANVLLAAKGPKLLDAEIAHFGDPAFDVGQLLGHLLLPFAARGESEQIRPTLRRTWLAYCSAAGENFVALGDAAQHAGIELLRRTLGAARVPAVESDEASQRVVRTAVQLVGEGLALD